MDQLLRDYKKIADINQAGDSSVGCYFFLFRPVLDSLKSITGKEFETGKDYETWWKAEGAKFVVQD